MKIEALLGLGLLGLGVYTLIREPTEIPSGAGAGAGVGTLEIVELKPYEQKEKPSEQVIYNIESPNIVLPEPKDVKITSNKKQDITKPTDYKVTLVEPKGLEKKEVKVYSPELKTYITQAVMMPKSFEPTGTEILTYYGGVTLLPAVFEKKKILSFDFGGFKW